MIRRPKAGSTVLLWSTVETTSPFSSSSFAHAPLSARLTSSTFQPPKTEGMVLVATQELLPEVALVVAAPASDAPVS